MTYINKGTTLWLTGQDPDFDYALGEQTAAWYFEKDDDGTNYIVLADNTAWPYISTDDQYQHPRFKVETLTNKKLEPTIDLPRVRQYLLLAERQLLANKRFSTVQLYFDVDPL